MFSVWTKRELTVVYGSKVDKALRDLGLSWSQCSDTPAHHKELVLYLFI
jgi:hypothetical protein